MGGPLRGSTASLLNKDTMTQYKPILWHYGSPLAELMARGTDRGSGDLMARGTDRGSGDLFRTAAEVLLSMLRSAAD